MNYNHRHALNLIGFVGVLVIFFWLVGLATIHPTPNFAAAVGGGVLNTIKFFVTVIGDVFKGL